LGPPGGSRALFTHGTVAREQDCRLL
jgi:hypothetical protein